MKEKLQRFMMGRYGADQLSKLLLALSMIFLILSFFRPMSFAYLIAIALLVYTYFRMFSKNIQKRYEENQNYLNWRYRLAVKKDQQKKHWEQRKIYHFYRCPSCKQKVRVPRGKGKICITCPKCKMEFVRKS